VPNVDKVCIIAVPKMLHWAGAGAAETGANPCYRASGGK